MTNFIEELYYGNIDPQNSGFEDEADVQHELQTISENEDWLTEHLTGEEKKRFLETLTENGWETMEAGGWIQMRKASHEPPANWHESPFGPKAACCRSLLERHPEGSCSDAEKVQCILIKAAEEGEKAFESACAELHHSWAECLRKGKPLPAVHPAYFSDRRE